MHNKKAKNKSFILLALILIVGAAYILYTNMIMSNLTEDFLSDMIIESTNDFSQNIKSKIKFVEALASLEVFTDNDVLFEDKLSGLDSFVQKSDLTRLLLIDMEGNGIASGGERVYISGREYFDKASKGESYFSQPFKSLFMERWVSVVAVPVLNAEQQVIYVLAAGIDEYDFISLHKNNSEIYKNKAYILGKSFNYVLEYNDMKDSREIKLMIDLVREGGDTEAATIAGIIMSQGHYEDFGYAEYVYNGVKKYLAYLNIEGTDFIFVSTVEKDMVFKEIKDAVTINNSITLFVLIILSALIYYNIGLSSNIKVQQEKTSLAVDVTKLLIIEAKKNSNEIISANENALALLGYTESEFSKMSVFDLFYDKKSVEGFWNFVDENLINKAASSKEFSLIKKDGTILHSLWKAVTVEKGIYEFFGSDISELKMSQEQINWLAYYDQLTGLQNRISLEAYLKEILSVSDAKFGFIYVDIDNFKYVNDTFDHNFGDKIIVEISKRILKLNESLPPGKTARLFRIGGDEFAVICRGFEEYGEIGDYSNMLYNAVCQEYDVENLKISITVSIGLSIYPDYSSDLPDIFKTAEIAMINAKELGKSRVTFFNKIMKNELETIVCMSSDLEEAFAKKEFVLYYQPQYDMHTGEIYGYEALMRWISSKRGIVPPKVFIPYAERSHIINKMGLWAFEEAARFSNELRKVGYENLKISVNISVVQLLDEGFVGNILHILEKTKADAHNIYMELTESTMKELIDISVLKINQLNEAGIRFSLDDFGTGYSSLTHLKKLPIDILKINTSFVGAILERDNDTDKQIMTAIIKMAREINLKVVAEGVEEKAQLDWLRANNCDICQGFYTGRPLPRAEAMQRLMR